MSPRASARGRASLSAILDLYAPLIEAAMRVRAAMRIQYHALAGVSLYMEPRECAGIVLIPWTIAAGWQIVPDGKMMNDRDLLIEIIARELDVEQSAISEGSTLDGLGADSPHLLEVALAIEEQFGITIPDADLARLRTRLLSELITYVQRRRGS